MNPRKLTPSMAALLAFEASARHESFTRAAEELSLTQSAVSRQVQSLEELLEIELFMRVGRHVVLTEVGKMYLRELGGALDRIRDATLQAIAYRSGGGSLHLAVLPTFGSKWLLPRLPTFYSKHPGILVHIHSRIGQFDLERSGMDAAIGVGDGQWPNAVSRHLIDEVLVPIVAPSSAIAKTIKTPEDMQKQLLLQVVARPATWKGWFAAQSMRTNDLRLGPQFELTSHLIQAVAAGIGVGLVPRLLIEDELKNGTLTIPLDAPSPTGVGYYLFESPRRASYTPLIAFREWLVGQKA